MANKDELRASVFKAVEAYCAADFGYAFDPKNPVVRLHEPTFSAGEINAALECLLSTYVTMGPKVKKFEETFVSTFGWTDGVMNNSGSSANLLAVAALANPATKDGLKPGDEVIVPALSWSTTVWPIIQCGLVPVIVDIDPATFNIDPNEIEKAIGPKTRAVMIVPVYGNPCAMDAIVDICKRRNLILIEDCCEALGAYYDGKAVGKFGRVGTFSFYFSHHLTTLEGGITVTDDFELAELMRILRAHGWVREVKDRDRWLKQYPDIRPALPVRECRLQPAADGACRARWAWCSCPSSRSSSTRAARIPPGSAASLPSSATSSTSRRRPRRAAARGSASRSG